CQLERVEQLDKLVGHKATIRVERPFFGYVPVGILRLRAAAHPGPSVLLLQPAKVRRMEKMRWRSWTRLCQSVRIITYVPHLQRPNTENAIKSRCVSEPRTVVADVQ